MKSLWCVLVLTCAGCEPAMTAPDATAVVRDVTADETSADALDATMLADVVGAREAAVDAVGDVVGDLAANGDVAATPCPAATQRLCDGVCVDVDHDDLRCGACDGACPSGTQCERGRCVSACLAGESICNRCDENRDDIVNCGV